MIKSKRRILAGLLAVIMMAQTLSSSYVTVSAKVYSLDDGDIVESNAETSNDNNSVKEAETQKETETDAKPIESNNDTSEPTAVEGTNTTLDIGLSGAAAAEKQNVLQCITM